MPGFASLFTSIGMGDDMFNISLNKQCFYGLLFVDFASFVTEVDLQRCTENMQQIYRRTPIPK